MVLEDYTHKDDGVEFWLARDLQNLLDYDEWRNFVKVIEKARTACRKSGQDIKDHFVEVNKMMPVHKGTSERYMIPEI